MPRSVWHADEKSVVEKPAYVDSVQAVFVHHTNHDNIYDCRKDVPVMLLSMEEHHIHDLGWSDLGYNYVVDRCGNIYEGRAGGRDRTVLGAHTEGFNARSVGIAALGHYGPGEKVPRPMLEAIAAVAAWKLPPRANPLGRVRLTSSNDESRVRKGASMTLNVISGHRDAYETDCPGSALYDELPRLRRAVARLRKRAQAAHGHGKGRF
ncbi:N-acetylmuramoyl-L-alanine amidase [Streptomyces sp. NPDC088725]|uniref:N-acetylmuramoyl-L-alanine amidase n=1 Tax=Streptomyces sp. NPDC088725 TaxID=3365873 RepID=UPI00382091BF